MGEDGARGKGTGASPVSYRHNFLVGIVLEGKYIRLITEEIRYIEYP